MQLNTQTNPETGPPSISNKRRSGCLVWVARGAAALALLFIVLAIAGAVYQSVSASRNAREFPAPGRIVDVGGRNIHLNCTGENVNGRPTVILETLSGGLSPYWGWVQPEIAETTRVCSYDRAGRGWSDPDPELPTLARTAADLHTALQAAGEAGPFVLVGHSIGGLYARRFAADYADDVAGLVLVDAAHPEQFDRYPAMRVDRDSFSRNVTAFPALARLGLFSLYFGSGGELDFQDLPARQHDETGAFLSSPGHWRSVRDELITTDAIFADAQALGDLGALPLAVVTAGNGANAEWLGMQAELAALSTNSMRVTVEDAIHASLAFNEAHAQEMSAAILAVVEAVAGGRSLDAGN